MYTKTENILIAWKWLLSFGKKDWSIADYPVRVRENGKSPEPGIAFCAQMLNWPGPAGLGPTKDQAVAQLKQHLEEIRKHRDSMPRPGTHVPIQFAPTVRLAKKAELLDDFIQRVLLFTKNDPVFLSDESSLHDFGDAAKVHELATRTKDVYSIDVTDIADGTGNIADILDRIKEAAK